MIDRFLKLARAIAGTTLQHNAGSRMWHERDRVRFKDGCLLIAGIVYEVRSPHKGGDIARLVVDGTEHLLKPGVGPMAKYANAVMAHRILRQLHDGCDRMELATERLGNRILEIIREEGITSSSSRISLPHGVDVWPDAALACGEEGIKARFPLRQAELIKAQIQCSMPTIDKRGENHGD